MPLALVHLWIWHCAYASKYGLHNHFNLGYSQFLYWKVLLPTFVPNVTLRFFTPSCSFHKLRLWLILVSSFVHNVFQAPSLAFMYSNHWTLCNYHLCTLFLSIPTVLVSKPEHTSNKTLKHSHCHSTPKFHHNYTLCLSTALLATTSQF